MASRNLRCYAEGRDGDWEAICLDLDIAVQGGSFEEVFESLQKAISLYLESVTELPPQEQCGLLHRPAPFSVRFRFLAHALSGLSPPVMVTDSAISSPCLSPLEALIRGMCVWAVPTAGSSRTMCQPDVVVLAMAGDHDEPRSAASAPLVDAMARTALPIQLEAVPHQDTNEIPKFHTL